MFFVFFSLVLFAKTLTMLVLIGLGFFENSVIVEHPIFFIYWAVVLAIGGTIISWLCDDGCQHEELVVISGLVFVGMYFLAFFSLLSGFNVMLSSAISSLIFFGVSVMVIFHITEARIIAEIVLGIQALLLGVMIAIVKDISFFSNLLGLGSFEESSLFMCVGVWGVYLVFTAVSSFHSLSAGEYSVVVSTGLFIVGAIIGLFLLFLHSPNLVFIITVLLMGITVYGLPYALGGVVGGIGSASREEESSSYMEDEEEKDRKAVRMAKIFNEGLEEGRKNNYKRKTSAEVTFDALTASGKASLSSGYDEEERKVWEKAYRTGYWED